MMNKLKSLLTIVTLIVIVAACSKGGGTNNPPANPCSGITINVSATITNATNATTSDGGLGVSATGGSSFTFSKDGTNFQSSASFTGLAAGNYTITAKNENGCTGSRSFTVGTVPCPTISVTATITQTSSPTATNGAIAATATGGSTPYTYSKDNGATFQATGTFGNLAIGTYTILAKDANGCTGTNSFSVTAASCPTITIITTPTNTTGPTATNGSISVSASGGATPYTYSKDNGATFQASNVFGNLTANSYAVVAKDANGCLSNVSNTTVGVTCPTLGINSTLVPSDKCANNTGSITINASGSTGFTYNLNNGSYQASNVFGLLGIGNYTIGAKDVNGCTTTTSVTITQAPAGTLFTSVKAVLAANCVSCHGGPFPQNGLNFADDCTIVTNGARIKARAVDFNPSQMPPSGPPISAADRQKIVDWLAAGGKHSN